MMFKPVTVLIADKWAWLQSRIAGDRGRPEPASELDLQDTSHPPKFAWTFTRAQKEQLARTQQSISTSGYVRARFSTTNGNEQQVRRAPDFQEHAASSAADARRWLGLHQDYWYPVAASAAVQRAEMEAVSW